MKEKSKRHMGNRGILIILALSAFFIGLDSLVVSPLIPLIQESTHTAAERGGFLITAYALFYGLSAPLFGPISDRMGRKFMIVTGMLLFSIGTFLTGISNEYYTILIFRALTGISGAIVMPSVFALVGDQFSNQEKGRAMGIVMGAMIGSTVIGVPVGAFLSEMFNWQMTFWAIGLMAFLVFIVAWKGLPDTTTATKAIPDSAVQRYVGQFMTAFTNRSILCALLTTWLWTMGLHTVFSYIGVFYHEKFNLDTGEIGLVILAAGVGGVIGNLLGGKWSDKVGKKKVIYLASFSSAVLVLCFSSVAVHLAITVLFHVLWSASIGVGQSSLTALISELNPKARGTVMSLNSSAMYLGMTMASGSASLLLGNFPFLSLGLLSAVSALTVLAVIGKVVIVENSSEKRLSEPKILGKA